MKSLLNYLKLELQIANCKTEYYSRLSSDIDTEPVLIETRFPISFPKCFALHILGDDYNVSNIAQRNATKES